MQRNKNSRNYGTVDERSPVIVSKRSIDFFFLGQRAAREAIERDRQIREMFADLDTNGDSLYVRFFFEGMSFS